MDKEVKMFLGLDISSSYTGYSIIDTNGKLILSEFEKLADLEDFFKKVEAMELIFKNLSKKYKITSITIEQSLSAFRPGLSSANVLLILAKMNGTVSWLAYKEFGIIPDYIAAISARKSCGITVPRGENAKELVLKHVLANEPSFSVEYTKKGNPKAGTYDRADSYVLAKYGYSQWLMKQKNLKS